MLGTFESGLYQALLIVWSIPGTPKGGKALHWMDEKQPDLEERVWRHGEAQTEKLLLYPLLTPQQPQRRRFIRR